MNAPPADAVTGAQKAQLRNEALALRKAMPEAARAALAQRLLADGADLVTRQGAAIVSLFWPIRDEPDVLPLLAALARSGITTALPVTGARGTPLVFRAWQPGDPQVQGPMRIPEPAPHLPAVEPDLLFVPLTVFDARGHRIGYGAGHYDCSLQRLRSLKPVTAVGVAFAATQVANVPHGRHDERLDFILTENGLLDCREQA